MDTQASLTQKSQWVEKYPMGYINFNKKNNTFKPSLLKNKKSIQTSIKNIKKGNNIEDNGEIFEKEDTIALTYENFSNKKEYFYFNINRICIILLILLVFYILIVKKIFIII